MVRINNNNNENYDANSKSYTVTGTLSWAPTSNNNGQTLYCDVFHPDTSTTNTPQTVGLPLTINGKKTRQHNNQKKKDKRTNNDLQNIHIKLNIE
jgi:hypothetical protein